MSHNFYKAALILSLLFASGISTAAVFALDSCKVEATVSHSSQTLPVPLGSTVLLICTLPTSSDPLWSVDLSSDSHRGRFQFDTQSARLNAHGLYELPSATDHETEMITLRLLINNTAVNNQTRIDCAGGLGQSFLATLFVFEPTECPTLLITWADVNSINLTWSQGPLLAADVMQVFLLNITHRSSSHVVSLNEHHYNFTAPEGAPPCEVYNFSVTAAYAGATYTGPRCGVHSPVLSTMLPSLPNIEILESSLNYSLSKQGKEMVVLNLSFEEARVCEKYPLLNYTLAVNTTSHGEMRQLVRPGLQKDNRVNLKPNAVYSFKVIVTNAIGIVSTKYNKLIYTTDVQSVSALSVKNQRSFLVHCDFLKGSDTKGCMIILQGKYENVTVNLTRKHSNSNCDKVMVKVSEPTSYYHKVHAFDINYYGGVGTLAIPGELTGESSTVSPCTTNFPRTGRPNMTVAVMLPIASMVVIAAYLVVVVVVTIIWFKKYRCKVCDIKMQGTEEENSKPQNIQLHLYADNAMATTFPEKLQGHRSHPLGPPINSNHTTL